MNGIFYQEAQGCSLSLKYHTTNVCMMMVQQVVVVHFCDLRTASTAFPTRFRYVSFLIHRHWVTFPGAWSFAVGLSRFCMRVNKAFSSFFSSPVPVMVLDPDKDSCARRVPLNHIFERSRTGFLWLTNIRKVDKYPQRPSFSLFRLYCVYHIIVPSQFLSRCPVSLVKLLLSKMISKIFEEFSSVTYDAFGKG